MIITTPWSRFGTPLRPPLPARSGWEPAERPRELCMLHWLTDGRCYDDMCSPSKSDYRLMRIGLYLAAPYVRADSRPGKALIGWEDLDEGDHLFNLAQFIADHGLRIFTISVPDDRALLGVAAGYDGPIVNGGAA